MPRHGTNHPAWWWLLSILPLLAAGGIIIAAVNHHHPVQAPHHIAVPQPIVFPPVKHHPVVRPRPVMMTLYRVQPGDNLWDIARTHCGNALDWVKLWHGNKIKNPNLIYPKMIIKLTC